MHPFALDILISLVFSSKHHPIDGLPIWLSMAIVVGALYGCLQLLNVIWDFLTKLWHDLPLDLKDRK
jgi:hypothetical protein